MKPIQHSSSGLQEQMCEHGHYDPALEVTQHAFCHTLLAEAITSLLISRDMNIGKSIPESEAII